MTQEIEFSDGGKLKVADHFWSCGDWFYRLELTEPTGYCVAVLLEQRQFDDAMEWFRKTDLSALDIVSMYISKSNSQRNGVETS